MRRRQPRARQGRSPGLVTVEDVAGRPASRLQVFSYSEQELEERTDASVDEALALVDPGRVTWINVDGLGDLDALERLWDAFDVPSLAREDIVHVQQRPKFEEYDGQGFLTLQMLRTVEHLESEQVAVVFGAGWVLSFQERPGDLFDGVRDRLRAGRRRIRSSGPDYLAYALLDAVVDGFFPVLEDLGEQLERAEEEALSEPTPDTVRTIHGLKRTLLTVRRALWPVREAVAAMQRSEQGLVGPDTQTYLRDAYDHAVRVMDMLETYRELATSLTEVYYSTLSQRLNEVMKVLTMAATIFIPLTFVAGIYGMNFESMPELSWRYGYPAALGVMALVALLMVWLFRRKGWL